jgi:hypothetical protein
MHARRRLGPMTLSPLLVRNFTTCLVSRPTSPKLHHPAVAYHELQSIASFTFTFTFFDR